MDGDSAGEAWRGYLQEPALGDTPGAEVRLVHGAPWTKPCGARPRSPSGCTWCCPQWQGRAWVSGPQGELELKPHPLCEEQG